jgi:hypothetical protein
MRHLTAIAAFLAVAVAAPVAAPRDATADELVRANPENYLRLLAKLTPGQTLELEAGEYRGGLPIHRLNGEPGKPIVVSGVPGADKPRFLARQRRNTVSIVDSGHVVVRGLRLDGLNLVADAVKAEGTSRFAHDITVEDLEIVGHGLDQSIVGISTMCTAWNWTIRGNVIVGAGTGMYLGHSNGLRPFVAGVIENNVVLNTIGYNIQIKQQEIRPNLPGLPTGRSVTIIRNNVFSKAGGGSTGKRARPNLLVGHWPPDGPGRDDLYAIYGNFFHDNPHEALFQGEGNFALYSNVFLNTQGDAIHVQPHKDVPRDVRVAFNTVIAADTALAIRTGPEARKGVVGNVLFSGQETDVGGAGNIVLPYEGWVRDQANGVRLPMLPVLPAGGTAPVAFESGLLSDLPHWDRDFEGRVRLFWRAGAYAEDRARWHWQLRRKP